MSRKQEIEKAAADLPVLDEEGMLERVDGNRDLLREVVGLFLAAYPRQREELRAAIERGDAGEVARVAHTIKGSVAFFCAGPAVELARGLEMMGRRADLAAAPAAEAELTAAMGRLTAALNAFAAADGETPSE
jgi:HPt (histidine-containing phosphotransfer) domain-containing protein